ARQQIETTSPQESLSALSVSIPPMESVPERSGAFQDCTGLYSLQRLIDPPVPNLRPRSISIPAWLVLSKDRRPSMRTNPMKTPMPTMYIFRDHPVHCARSVSEGGVRERIARAAVTQATSRLEVRSYSGSHARKI